MTNATLQTTGEPLQSIEDIKKFMDVQQREADWVRATLLADKDNVIILLLSVEDTVLQVLRICLEDKQEITSALKMLNKKAVKLSCGYLMDGIGQIDEINDVTSALGRADLSTKTSNEAYQFFEYKEKGRGHSITTPIARQVVFESHGYCMFEGCGVNLSVDDLTGVKGNYRYLAHIVASSADGPRGNEHSQYLSNVASNIMVLCDKHHRLVDKVAVSDYSAKKLTIMKQAFSDNCDLLLQSLAYQPVPTYTAFWPIGNYVPEDPSPQEYAVSLHPVHCRPSGAKYRLIERKTEIPYDDHWWANQAADQLNTAGMRFSAFGDGDRHRAGIYAMGPSTMLIGLGTVLGNKNNLCVVPRSREHGWKWARTEPIEKPLTIEGLASISKQVTEVAITLFLTDTPAESESVLEYLSSMGIPSIHIKVNFPGNTSIAHHQESAALREQFLDLLHMLRNQYEVSRVHLLHCASNVACVEIGRAIEHNHPSVRIYDHWKADDHKYMVPRLDLITGSDQVQVAGTPLEDVSLFHEHFQSAPAGGVRDDE